MRDALLKYWDQPILYALCEWGEDDVWLWGNETGHSWRISGDIWPYPYPRDRTDSRSWESIVWIANIQARTWMYSGPYGYGDMDMLGMILYIKTY
jgi:alpha-galactosidase